MIKDSLLYPVADMLAIPLHELQSGVVKGAGTQMMGTLGWKTMAEIVVASDVIEPKRSAFFARVFRTLWMYIVVEDGKDIQTKVYMIDGQHFGWKAKDVATVGKKDIEATIEAIQPGVVGVLTYDPKKNLWSQDAVDLESAVAG